MKAQIEAAATTKEQLNRVLSVHEAEAGPADGVLCNKV